MNRNYKILYNPMPNFFKLNNHKHKTQKISKEPTKNLMVI